MIWIWRCVIQTEQKPPHLARERKLENIFIQRRWRCQWLLEKQDLMLFVEKIWISWKYWQCVDNLVSRLKLNEFPHCIRKLNGNFMLKKEIPWKFLNRFVNYFKHNRRFAILACRDFADLQSEMKGITKPAVRRREQQRNANKKWEMPRLFGSKWKALFNIIVSCLWEERFASFFRFIRTLTGSCDDIACCWSKNKTHISFPSNNSPHIVVLAWRGKEGEYLKNDETFSPLTPQPSTLVASSSFSPFSFYLFAKDYFVSVSRRW